MNLPASRFAAVAVCLCLALSAPAAPHTLIPIAEAYNPPPVSSDPYTVARVGTRTFFVATTLAAGRELWVTDGTSAGTYLVKDIIAGAGSPSFGTSFVEFQGLLYFMADGALWKSNGTAAGTLLVKKIGLTNVMLRSAGSLLYLVSAGNYSEIVQIWASDGTADRTLRVRTFWSSLQDVFAHDGKLFFTTNEDALLGRQIWVSNGTLFGTHVIAAGNPCPATSSGGCSNGVKFFRLGTKLFFTAGVDSWVPQDLWTTDGTTMGTTLVQGNAGTFLAANASLAWLAANDELRKTNGTAAGTASLKVLPDTIMTSGAATTATKLFAFVDKSYQARELWKSDGTTAGTSYLGTTWPYEGQVVASDTHFFFGVRTGIYPNESVELFATDGSGAPAIVKDIAGTTNSGAKVLSSAGSYILFSAYTPEEGRELWRSDGTANGTFVVKNIAAETVTGAVSGTVRIAQTNTPVAGARVTVYSKFGGELGSVVSANDGTYRIDQLTTDQYYLSVATDAHVRQVYPNLDCAKCSVSSGQLVAVSGGFVTSNIDFSLTAGARFSGSIVTAAGDPHQNGVVVIYGPDGGEYATGKAAADGTFLTAPGLPAGPYYAVAYPDDPSWAAFVYGGGPCSPSRYVYSSDCSPATTGTPLNVSLGSTTSLSFRLSETPRIAGRVTDQGSGSAIANIFVRIYDATSGVMVADTRTNAAGDWSTGPMPSGSYVVLASGSSSGYVDEVWHNLLCSPSCDVLSGRIVSPDFGAPATGLDFALASTQARIRGTVTQEGTGLPVPYAYVSLYTSTGSSYWSSGSTGQTDAQGRYEYRGMPEGTYYLKVQNQLHENLVCQSCDVTTGKPIVVGPGKPAVTVDVVLRKRYNISGRVTDATTGLPVASARVSLRGQSGYAETYVQTDVDGRYTVPEPELGTFYMTVHKAGYVSEAYNNAPIACSSDNYHCGPAPAAATIFDPVAIVADRPGVDFALDAQGGIRGTVRTSDGQPLPGASVTLYTSAGYLTSVGVNAQGGFEFYLAQPGTYYLRADGNSTGYGTQLYNGIACSPYCPDASSGTPVNVTTGSQVTGIDFTLPRMKGEVRGQIVDDATGKALAGVPVHALDQGGSYPYYQTVTGSDGRYVLANVSPGTYRIRAYKAGTEYLGRVYGGDACSTDDACRAATGGTLLAVAAGGVLSNVDLRLPKIAILTVSPAFGPISGGSRVTLTGINFPAAFTLKIDGLTAQIVSATATQIVLNTPTGSIGPANFILTAGEQLMVAANAFTYITSSVAGDINGDFRSDVFWRSTTGANDAWLMDGRYAPFTRTFASLSDTAWDVQTLGDFDGDGLADIFWRNANTGQNVLWLMRSASPLYYYVATQALGWRVIGAGDFDLDGRDDLFWRNDNGQTQVWFGNGASFRIASGPSAGLPWQPQAIGDVNGDGRADVLWRNASTGQNSAWLMNGTAVTVRILPTMGGSSWRMAGARDTDGDGMADIFWRNESTGEHSMWLVNGSSVTFRTLLRVDLNWKPIGMGDFTGDGRADIFWRHAATGQLSVWTMSGGTLSGTISFGSRSTNWKPYLAH